MLRCIFTAYSCLSQLLSLPLPACTCVTEVGTRWTLLLTVTILCPPFLNHPIVLGLLSCLHYYSVHFHPVNYYSSPCYCLLTVYCSDSCYCSPFLGRTISCTYISRPQLVACTPALALTSIYCFPLSQSDSSPSNPFYRLSRDIRAWWCAITSQDSAHCYCRVT
jgi:hypothetical protein